MFGLSPARVRFWSVTLTSLYPAIAGILYAQAIGYLGPDYFNKSLSLSFLIIAIVGGVRRIWGAILGAVIWIVTPELTASVVGGFPIVFGTLAVMILLWRPDGLVGIGIHGGDLVRRAFRGLSNQVGLFTAMNAPGLASRSAPTHDQGRSK